MSCDPDFIARRYPQDSWWPSWLRRETVMDDNLEIGCSIHPQEKFLEEPKINTCSPEFFDISKRKGN